MFARRYECLVPLPAEVVPQRPSGSVGSYVAGQGSRSCRPCAGAGGEVPRRAEVAAALRRPLRRSAREAGSRAGGGHSVSDVHRDGYAWMREARVGGLLLNPKLPHTLVTEQLAETEQLGACCQ